MATLEKEDEEDTTLKAGLLAARKFAFLGTGEICLLQSVSGKTNDKLDCSLQDKFHSSSDPPMRRGLLLRSNNICTVVVADEELP